MQLVETIQTPYNEIDVWDTDQGFEFQVTGATHAAYHNKHLMTGQAWDAITAAALLHPMDFPQNVLMLGLAGGTAVRQLRHLLPHAKITAIEIDSTIVQLARKYMHLDDWDVEVIIADAYAYTAQTIHSFDVVIDDIYLSGIKDVHRPRAIDRTVLQQLKQQTHPEGIICANLVTGAGHRTMQKMAKEGFVAAFDEVRIVTPPDSYNQTLVGGKSLRMPKRLKEFTSQLTAPYDQRKWNALKVTRAK